MNRRGFVRSIGSVLGLSAAATAGMEVLVGCQLLQPAAATPARVRRIGVLSSGTPGPYWDVLVDQLRQLGWVEGDNLTIEWRFAEGRAELLPQLAADLVGLPVEIIVADLTNAALAAKQQTNSIPIVMDEVSDPVAAGLITSLAHPGGNVTGTTAGSTLNIKSVEMFKTVLPQLSRLAVLEDQSYPTRASILSPVMQTAAKLGIQTLDQDVRGVQDVDATLDMARAWRAEGLLVIPIPSFRAGVNARVAELAAQQRLPVMFLISNPVTDYGGLMVFTVDTVDVNRQGAEYVDKLLRGAKPGDLPVEEPRQFQFMVNVKAAQALGITLPPDAATQVTQWIQ